MPRSTTEIANAIMTPKGGHMSCSTMAKPKPFVVTSVTTERYGPARNKAPLQKIPLRARPPMSTKERPPALPRWVQTSRPASLPTVVPTVEPRRPLPKSVSMPAPKKTARVQKPLLLPLVSFVDQPFPEKTPSPEPLKVMQGMKEGELVCPYPVSVRWMTTDQPPPRPSCVPRTCNYRSSVGGIAASKGKKEVLFKVSTTGLRNPGITCQKPSVNTRTAKTTGRVRVSDLSNKQPAVSGSRRTSTPTCNRRLTLHPIVYPHVEWSPPPSPDLSSFPSQSWTIVVDVGRKQIETLSRVSEVPKSGVTRTPKDSRGQSESASSSPTSPPSATIVETPASPAVPIAGSVGTVEMNTPTKEPSTEVSHLICDATIISPSGNGATSMATLAKVIDRSRAPLPSKASDSGNRTRMTVRRVVQIAQAFFSPSRRTSHSAAETAAFTAMGTNVSRIQKLLIPPLDKDTKAQKNPMMQIEIEMLRARRKVAGGGMVDPCLDRLGSLAAMAIVTKLRTSGSDSTD